MLFSGKLSKWMMIVLLISLGYQCRMEMSAFGLRVFALVIDSPVAERMLATYHEEKQILHQRQAYFHYNQSLQHLMNQYEYYVSEQQGFAAMIIGSHYECGRGVSKDLNKAKLWYTKAKEKGLNNADEALARIQQNQPCIHNK